MSKMLFIHEAKVGAELVRVMMHAGNDDERGYIQKNVRGRWENLGIIPAKKFIEIMAYDALETIEGALAYLRVNA